MLLYNQMVKSPSRLIKELHSGSSPKKDLSSTRSLPKKSTKKRKKKAKNQTLKTPPKRSSRATTFFSTTNPSKKHTKSKPSKKWNDASAKDLQKELEKLRDMKEEDPNSFDRFAMK